MKSTFVIILWMLVVYLALNHKALERSNDKFKENYVIENSCPKTGQVLDISSIDGDKITLKWQKDKGDKKLNIYDIDFYKPDHEETILVLSKDMQDQAVVLYDAKDEYDNKFESLGAECIRCKDDLKASHYFLKLEFKPQYWVSMDDLLNLIKGENNENRI